MAYDFEVTHKDNYLHIKVTGENSASAVGSYLRESVARCAEMRSRVALVEDALTGPDLGLDDLFEIIRDAAEAARPVVDLVAYVKTTPGHDTSIVRMAENIAANHEVNVRVFTTVAEAQAFIAHHSRPHS